MERKNALDANAKTDPADRERGTGGAALLGEAKEKAARECKLRMCCICSIFGEAENR